MRGGRDAKPQTTRVIAPSLPASPQRVARVVRTARRARRVGRCGLGVPSAVDRPRLSSSTARSAARLPPLPPPLRPRHPWPLAEPLSQRPELFADRSARPCDRA